MQVLKDQHWHLLFLILLLGSVFFYLNNNGSLLQGKFWSMPTSTWLVLAILAPIIHQVYVLICWRLELYYHSLSKSFGAKSFKLYKIGFAILILSRLVTIIILAHSSPKTLNLKTEFAYLLASIFFLLSAYLFYSVFRYFGIDRAFGKDHFHPEEFKNEPFVKQGIFKYTANGMYLCGFFILWIPGLLLLSKAAILVALFNHAYIWVHYYFTELPDMKRIYGEIE